MLADANVAGPADNACAKVASASPAEHPPVAEEVESGRWVLDGRYQIYDLNELLDTTLPEDDDFDTVAGFVLERLGRVPEVDESFEVAGLRFRVLDATPTHIERLQIERIVRELQRAPHQGAPETPRSGSPSGPQI